MRLHLNAVVPTHLGKEQKAQAEALRESLAASREEEGFAAKLRKFWKN